MGSDGMRMGHMITCFSKKTESQGSTEHRLRGLTCKTGTQRPDSQRPPTREACSSPQPPEGAQSGARQFLAAATRGHTALSLPLPWISASRPKRNVILSHMNLVVCDRSQRKTDNLKPELIASVWT